MLSLLLLILAGACPAAEPEGWVKQGSSLLLFDSSHTLVSEIALGTWEEASGGRVEVSQTQAGAAESGRFAWVLESKTSWNQPKTKKLGHKAALRLLPAAGLELWSEPEFETPLHGAPAVFDRSGETILLCRRSKEGSRCSLRGYLGNTVVETGPLVRVLSLFVSASGKYAFARWDEPDKRAVHTFLDAARKRTKDVPSGEFLLGKPRLEDDGKVFSGSRLILDLGAEDAKP